MIECINGCGQMSQTMYEGVEIDICKSCAGVWLDTGEITTIVKTKENSWPESVIKKVLTSTGTLGVSIGEQNRNLSCPKCDVELSANNYQSNSGIIVNTCPNVHGVWLNAGELAKIQIYMEKWAEIAQQNSSKYQSILSELEQEHEEKIEAEALKGPSGSEAINQFLNKIVQLIERI